MKNKYYDKNFRTSFEKRIKKINNNSLFEKIYFKIITYIFLFISFFHQLLVEYMLFGFLGNILYFFGIFNSENFSIKANKSFSIYINEFFRESDFFLLG